jgi:hypothetical protein
MYAASFPTVEPNFRNEGTVIATESHATRERREYLASRAARKELGA